MTSAAGWVAPRSHSGATRVAAALGSERARRGIVALTVFVIVLLVLEGAIRKWLLPGYGRILFFVRDPFVIAIYCVALASGWWPRGRALLNACLAFGAVGLLLAGLQTMAGATELRTQLLLGVYGWRNYFLYVPLLFVIGATFRRADLAFVCRLLLVLAIPMAALVVLQFFSPLNARINVGIAEDAALQFKGLGLNAFHTRPMGTFTSDVGQREFIVSTAAFAIATWLVAARQRLAPWWLLAVGTAAALTCLAVSGSRGAMVHVGLLMGAAVGSAFVLKAGAGTLRALVIPPVLLIVAVWLYPIVFPAGHEAFTQRWDAASGVESQNFQWGLIGRSLYNFVDFVDLMGSTPVFGYGLGLAGNASILMGVEIDGFSGWTETDWARHVVDLGPLFGPAYMVFRVALVGWLTALALRALRRRGDPLALLLVTYAGVQMLQGQLTGHGSVNGFAWVFCGLALAAAQAGAREDEDAPRAAVLPTGARFPNLLR